MEHFLRILRPVHPDPIIPLVDQSVTLGRVQTNDVSFPNDYTLSRQHVMFVKREDGWVVRDLATRNGTRVNDELIAADRVLQDGDTISAGLVVMRFEDKAIQAIHTETTLSHALSSGASRGPVKLLVRACSEMLNPGPKGWHGVILAAAMQDVGADRGVLLIIENGELTVRASEGPDTPVSATIRARVLDQRLSVLAFDAEDEGRFLEAESLIMQGVRSLIAAPLQAKEHVHGMLYLHKTRAPHFGVEDLNTLTVLAHVAAMKREEEVLIERERQAEKLADARKRALELAELMRHAETRAVLAESAASLGRLAAAVSHEINSPLGALGSSVQTLVRVIEKARSASDSARLFALAEELCASIVSSVERLTAIAARLRRVTNLDRAEVQAVDLGRLLADVAQIVAPGGNSLFRLDLPELPEVVSRPQVLSAVFSAVLEFCRAGGARITARTSAESLTVRVEQPDREIPDDDLLQLFEPSFRSAGGKIGTQNWELFSARQMMRELGGNLYAESTPERGTTITVEIVHDRS